MSIKGIHEYWISTCTIDLECDGCGKKTATLNNKGLGIAATEWYCPPCDAKREREARSKFPRSITLQITKCEENVFEKMKDAIGKMAVDCHAIIGSHSVESETHEIE